MNYTRNQAGKSLQCDKMLLNTNDFLNVTRDDVTRDVFPKINGKEDKALII